MSAFDRTHGVVHGYIAVTERGGRVFTGTDYSRRMDDAKVFRTIGGTKCAVQYHVKAGYGEPEEIKVVPVVLSEVKTLL